MYPFFTMGHSVRKSIVLLLCTSYCIHVSARPPKLDALAWQGEGSFSSSATSRASASMLPGTTRLKGKAGNVAGSLIYYSCLSH